MRDRFHNSCTLLSLASALATDKQGAVTAEQNGSSLMQSLEARGPIHGGGGYRGYDAMAT